MSTEVGKGLYQSGTEQPVSGAEAGRLGGLLQEGHRPGLSLPGGPSSWAELG